MPALPCKMMTETETKMKMELSEMGDSIKKGDKCEERKRSRMRRERGEEK